MRPIKDFDEMCKDGNYIVKATVDDSLPPVTVYDNRTGTDSEYYGIYNKTIQKIEQRKGYYILYI